MIEKLTVLLLLLFFTIPGSLAAQQIVWLDRYDSGRIDQGAGGSLDPEGNLIVAGSSGDYGSRDITIIKYNPDGETLWTRTFDSNTDDRCSSCTVGRDGGVVVCGGCRSSFYLLVKYDGDGNWLWTVMDTVGRNNSALGGIFIDDSLNIYSSGITRWGENESLLFLRYGNDGTRHMRRITDFGYKYEGIFGFVNCPDGNFIGVGTVGEGYPPILDIIIAKFTKAGDTIWTRLLDIKPQDDAPHITLDSEGNIYITGDVYEDWGQGIVQPDSFVTACYRPDGTRDWVRVYGLKDYSWGTAIDFDPSGQLLVAGGSYDSIRNESSGAILCYLPDGTLAWHWEYRKENWNCWFYDIIVAEPGVCYVTGEVANADYDSCDFLIMKLRYPVGVEEPGRMATGVVSGLANSGPVRSGGVVRFSVSAAGSYRLTVADIAGQKRTVVYAGYLDAGEHRLRLPALSAGVYFLTTEAEGIKARHRLVVVR
jgi:hypothetical protein